MNKDENKKEIFSKLEDIIKSHSIKIWDIMELLRNYHTDNEILVDFSVDELIYYLENTFEFDEYLSDIEYKAIKKYERDNPVLTLDDLKKEICNYSKSDFKDFLCDITGNSYHIETEDLLNDIRKMIC
jgi:hypothetical protein